jgi:hypothetical protein
MTSNQEGCMRSMQQQLEMYNDLNIYMKMETTFNPCGGGVEYLHRDPASRKRRQNGAKKGHAIA